MMMCSNQEKIIVVMNMLMRLLMKQGRITVLLRNLFKPVPSPLMVTINPADSFVQFLHHGYLAVHLKLVPRFGFQALSHIKHQLFGPMILIRDQVTPGEDGLSIKEDSAQFTQGTLLPHSQLEKSS